MSGWLTVLHDMLAPAKTELLYMKAPVRSSPVEGKSEREITDNGQNFQLHT